MFFTASQLVKLLLQEHLWAGGEKHNSEFVSLSSSLLLGVGQTGIATFGNIAIAAAGAS